VNPPERKDGRPPKIGDDRATAPTPLEDASDAAWNEFVLLQSQSSSLGDTRPGEVPGGKPPPTGPRAAREPITVVSTMLLARRSNRTCPMPARWAQLHALLPPKDGKAAPGPVAERDWARVPPMQKRLRLRDHIEWASATGSLEAVHSFLVSLAETDWDHF
jgi:hypothetical protein